LVRPITPIWRRHRGAEGESIKTGGRGDVDDGAGALVLHHRHGAATGQKLRIETDRQAVAPVIEVHVLDGRGRPGDAGIVDEEVEPVQKVDRVVEPGVDRALIAGIDRRRHDVGIVVVEARQGLLVDVAGMHAMTFIGKGTAVAAPMPVPAAVIIT
jgi:hypothetical protein